ncbi:MULTISPECIES: LacI family transcriptional regulator [Lysobacter]|uniref:LacI family transcriptional regulator n=1 Tax=Lysobacter TaxID=68 RepID=UPI001F4081A5|nr:MULTISPECIES: LacI family transcriptional regulator [Lysobacter]UJB19238.1 LacI family transcriptional regulator [Lysobacter capsici]UJQ27037.1 LacI family transcriptional regulator [Lysobacter gummosus]
MSRPKLTVDVVAGSDGSLVFDIPLRIVKRGYRKLVQIPRPEGAQRPWDTRPTALQRALGRAERWRRMLESGEVSSINEIAAQEKTDFSYIARLLNLTTLAPPLVAAVLDDTLPSGTTVNDLAINPPHLWSDQIARLERKRGHLDD